MSEFKRCPFCNGDDVRLSSDDGFDGEVWYVKCYQCEAEGPSSGTRSVAGSLWNEREESVRLRTALTAIRDTLQERRPETFDISSALTYLGFIAGRAQLALDGKDDPSLEELRATLSGIAAQFSK